jgi:hypothetical protein
LSNWSKNTIQKLNLLKSKLSMTGSSDKSKPSLKLNKELTQMRSMIKFRMIIKNKVSTIPKRTYLLSTSSRR